MKAPCEPLTKEEKEEEKWDKEGKLDFWEIVESHSAWLLDGRCEISGEVELGGNSLKISQLTHH